MNANVITWSPKLQGAFLLDWVNGSLAEKAKRVRDHTLRRLCGRRSQTLL